MAGSVRQGAVRFGFMRFVRAGEVGRDKVRWGVVCLVWSVQARQAWLVRCDMVRTGWVFSGRLGEVGIGVVCKVLSGRLGRAGYGRIGFGVI